MRKFLFILALPLIFLASDCDRNPIVTNPGTLALNFKANYGGEPLVMLNDGYTYTSDMTVRFERANFFISNLVLVEESTNENVEMKEVDFVRFDDVSTTAEANTGQSISSNIPAGTYSTLKFSIGIPADLNNNTSKADFSPSHPLNFYADTHWWGGTWNTHIFAMFTGYTDTNNDGMFDDGIFNYHLGSNEVFTELTYTLPTPITLGENGTSTINLALDVKKMFTQSDSTMYDLTEIPTTHSMDNLPRAKEVMANITEALTIVE